MGRYLLPALLFLLALPTQAQVTFNKTIDFANGDDVASGVIELSDGYFVTGQGWGYEAGDYFDTKLKYTKIDLNGNVIYKRFIGDSAIWFYPGWGCIQTLDGNAVVAGGRVTLDDGDSDIQLIKFDPSTGDTIFHVIYENPGYSFAQSAQQFSDGSLLINAYDEDHPTTFLKTDINGNLTWQKSFGSVLESTSALFKLVDDSLTLVTSFGYCDPQGFTLRRIDSGGNVASEIFVENECPSTGWKSVLGGLLGLGADFPDNPFTTFVYRANYEGNILWKYSTSFDFDTLYDGQMDLGAIEELPNGDIIIGGYYASNPFGVYIAVVCKVNIEGEPYWERVYKSNDELYDDNIINALSLTSDGGFIMSGGAYSNDAEEDQNFWVLKLDSVGCLTPGCDSLDIPVMELPFNSEIAVYPNPANDFFVVQSGENFRDATEVQLLNTNGQLIQTANISKGANSVILHIEDVEAGFYIVKIIDQRNRVQVKKLMVEH